MKTNTTFKGAPKPYGATGHFDEPMRHKLQGSGFKTGHLAGGVSAGMPMPAPKGREVVVKYRVYKFDDLPKEAQQKALDKHRDINVDFDWWDYDGQLDLSADEMKEAGIKDSDYKKPGSMMISYEHKKMEFDIDRYMYLQYHDLKVEEPEVFRKFLGIPKSVWNKIDYHFENDRERNTRIEFDGVDHIPPSEQVIVDKARDKFSAKVAEAWRGLRDTFDDSQSDEQVAETFRANDYEFKENGEID